MRIAASGVQQMRRREFIAGLGAATAWPAAVSAQQHGAHRHIGMLFGLSENDGLGRSYVAVFRQRLQELGWIDGHNIQIDYRWGGDDVGRIRSQAVELVKLKPDVIVSQSGLTLPALQQATRTIPIVFTQVADPVASGYVASFARPDGNITGFAVSEFSTAGKMLEVLKEVAPAIDQVTVLFNLEQRPQVGQLEAIQSVAPSINVAVTPASVRGVPDIERAFDTLARTSNAGLIVLANAITVRHRDLIISLALRHRVPAAYRYRHYVAEGGLISYGERLEDLSRGAASYVDRILRGEKPGDLPVQQPTRFELIVNLNTAKAIGLSIPASFLLRADDVIE
jgi:putative tryptophan/tyrosine transport system substrate-binding protein